MCKDKGMKTHLDTGKTGEEMAAKWLQENGYEIVHRNWRYSYYELDIVAKKNNRLHFIEVKCRHVNSIGNPEDSVSKKKFRNLKRAADAYLQFYPNPWIQYDILAITLKPGMENEFFLLQDVFI